MFQQLSLAPNPQPDRHLKVFALCLTERDIAFFFFLMRGVLVLIRGLFFFNNQKYKPKSNTGTSLKEARRYRVLSRVRLIPFWDLVWGM